MSMCVKYVCVHVPCVCVVCVRLCVRLCAKLPAHELTLAIVSTSPSSTISRRLLRLHKSCPVPAAASVA